VYLAALENPSAAPPQLTGEEAGHLLAILDAPSLTIQQRRDELRLCMDCLSVVPDRSGVVLVTLPREE
jgi:hypothetical protein